jgi:pyruvate dehydrogenase E1 component
VYARAFLEGRISEDQLKAFRQEALDENGLSSYPHPWLMPDFWQFPTVSMGLGPIMAIYQARFMKYLENRDLQPQFDRKVWAFMGDGEMDEPESLGAISLASRENLDNLVFVINCNLQRLDGPVRGNGKVIQELEAVFRGAGWNVLKVVWGSYWDHLFAKDKDGVLQRLMEETVDGEYQAFKAKGGAYTREHFFGKYPETREMVADMSDEDIWRLNRGGHDPHKVYAAYAEAVECTGRPTVILAKTVKGYGMGEAGEGQNITHSQKKMGEDSLKAFRDRFNIPISDEDISKTPFYKFPEDSVEMGYMRQSREKLGGYMPVRSDTAEPLVIPGLEVFDALLKDSGDREFSTTMAFVRMLSTLARDKNIGKNIVPIVPDEARTFGMEGMFRQLGIYSSKGQLYEPMDSDQVMYYREDIKGQILEEGINEAGAMSSWIAAGSAYTSHGVSMIPFYIYYSMFGFQRIGDLAWAAGDMQVRGFLMGGTAGRTTLAGEGLQHQDGHSLVVAGTIPNCVSYDPTFAYELAVIIHSGMKRMYQLKDNVFYYISVMNENYLHPAMPKGSEEGIIKGIYCLQEGEEKGLKVQLMGSGTILREVIAAAELLKKDFKINADVWSVTSVNELAREAQSCARWNQLHPTKKARQSYLETSMRGRKGPVIISTDYIRAYAEQIREFVWSRFVSLGTDGFGRSDTRENLRIFFEVNRYYVVVAALKALSDDGELDSKVVQQAIKKYGIDPEKPDPVTV